ncbi:F-box protein SKIP22-like, partial [Carica papaya]|uniref:F-box protein SKIP22-like n=1 Tax=Carica papaya TaxID=3649 RepID=UPI000B8CA0E9
MRFDGNQRNENMRLRLRCYETRQTQKIELPDTCTVLQLQQSLSAFSPSSVRLSLNRKDELAASSPDDSLGSHGITTGDLVYYSNDPMAFTSPSQTLVSASSSVQATLHSGSTSAVETEDSVKLEDRDEEMDEESSVQDRLEEDFLSSLEKGRTSIQDYAEAMHVDDEYLEIAGRRKFSEPSFLRRVLTAELGDSGSQYKLLIAVHAVFLDSGFVGFDFVSGRRVDRLNLPDKWPSMVFSLSLWYTLPELLSNGSNSPELIVLKFQKLGHFDNVYGSLASGGAGLYRVCLDENKFLPAIDLILGDCDENGRMDDKKYWILDYEKVVFDFWRMVKDGIVLPLLIDLCDKAGLLLPACLMRLPTELKVKILESLPGIDVARMGCVCT